MKKILVRMKLTISLVLLMFLQVSAKVHSQEKLTLTEKAISWERFFDLLEKRSHYTFVYKNDVLPSRQKIDVTAVDQTIPQILETVFRNSPLTFSVLSGDLVVVTSRQSPMNEIRVTGKVLSAAGDPLYGASVKIKGTQIGTTTDSAGNFSLSVP